MLPFVYLLLCSSIRYPLYHFHSLVLLPHFKTVKDIVYFNCVLLPHMFIFQHIPIELFHVLFLLYPFQIYLNRSNYRVVIRTDVCTRICFCLFNTVSKSGVYNYVVDLVPCFAIRTNPCVFLSVWLCKPCVCYSQCS